jgi:hypothetical protein
MEITTEQYRQLMTQCWTDDAFKQRLLAEPAAVLQEKGIAIPDGLSLHVVENTDTHMTLVIPLAPRVLGDEDLEAVVGGTGPLLDTAGVGIVGLVAGLNQKQDVKETADEADHGGLPLRY